MNKAESPQVQEKEGQGKTGKPPSEKKCMSTTQGRKFGHPEDGKQFGEIGKKALTGNVVEKKGPPKKKSKERMSQPSRGNSREWLNHWGPQDLYDQGRKRRLCTRGVGPPRRTGKCWWVGPGLFHP